MKPILFDKAATSFLTNGLGRLDCISCKVIEERNGMYELEAEIAEDDLHAKEIEMDSIIVAKPFDGGNNQPFRVYKITKPFNKRFKVYAQHISYQLSYVPAMPFSVEADVTACADALAGLKANAAENCPFDFETDVTTVSSYRQDVPKSIRSCLGGSEGSILDQFGGEYEWDVYTVKLHKNRGVTEPKVSLRYGKNITDLEQEEYISSTVTGICPFWKSTDGKNITYLPEKVLESQYADNYPFRRTETVDFSQDFEAEPTVEELRVMGGLYINRAGVGIPKVSIKVKFTALWQTEEYKDVAPLQYVKLCDNVGVYFERLGIATKAKVVRTDYDVLAERYDSIEIGSISTSLAGTITNTDGMISETLRKSIFAARNATYWLTASNGYVMAAKNPDGSWKELFFMDTNSAETAVHVLRINENGIGFSSHGVDGPYSQAWTLDGKLVIGGTDVPSLTVYEATEDPDTDPGIIFQTSRAGTIWNSENSSMSADGILEMIGAIIKSSRTGSRLTIDSTSSIKGVDHDEDTDEDVIYNLINMVQSVTGTHQMTIDAHDQLNIRTPQLYVIDESAGEGSLTAYQTHTGQYTAVSDVTKNTSPSEGCVELWVADAGQSEGDVYCTLPVFLNVEKTTYNRYLGMTVTGETTETVVI